MSATPPHPAATAGEALPDAISGMPKEKPGDDSREASPSGLFDDDEPGDVVVAENALKAEGENQQGLKEAEEESDGDKPDAELDDLFGDDDEEEDAKPAGSNSRAGSSAPTTPEGRGRAAPRSRSPSGSRSRSRSQSANPLEYPEEDDAPEVQESIATILLPPANYLNSDDDKLWSLKLPSYVGIDSKPYDPDTFRKVVSADSEEAKVEDKNEAVAKFLLAKNTIRWKWVTGADGKPKRQSNARFVKWSDGSFSLQLGSDLFDVATSMHSSKPIDNSSSSNSTSDFTSFTSSVPANSISNLKRPDANDNPDLLPFTYICRNSADMVLEVEDRISGNLSLVPTSTQSKTHMELVNHIDTAHARQSKLKVLDENLDRELLLKATAGGVAPGQGVKAKRTVNRTGSGGDVKRRTGGGGGGGRRHRDRDYSDDDSDDEIGVTGGGIRRGGRGYGRSSGGVIGADGGKYDEDDGFVVADDDDDDDDEDSDDSDGLGLGGGSDSGSSAAARRRKKNKKKAANNGGGSSRRKRDYDSPDLLEDADRLIEAQARQRKRTKMESGGGKGSSSKGGSGKRERREKKSRDYIDEEDDEEEEQRQKAKVQEEEDAEGEEEMDMDMDMETEEE